MKKILSIFFIVFIFVISGCSNKQKEVSLEQLNTHKNVIVEDSSILDWLAIENIASMVRSDNMLEVQVQTKNMNSKSKTVAYKIDWFDENGFLVETILSKWKLLQVEGKRGANIKGISPSQSVASFKIRFQEPSSDDVKRDMNVNIKEYRGE